MDSGEEWRESDNQMEDFDEDFIEHRSISPKIKHDCDSVEESPQVEESKENTFVWLVLFFCLFHWYCNVCTTVVTLCRVYNVGWFCNPNTKKALAALHFEISQK